MSRPFPTSEHPRPRLNSGHWLSTLGIVATLAGVGCDPKPATFPGPAPGEGRRTKIPEKRATLPGPRALPAVVVAELGSAKSQVFFARNGLRGLLVARGGGQWLTGTVNITAGGTATLNPHATEHGMSPIAEAPDGDAPILGLGAMGDGYLLSWADAEGHAIWAIELNREGLANGTVQRIATLDHATDWLQVLHATGPNGAVVWEAIDAGGKRDVRVSQWRNGKAGKAETIAEGILSWHAASNAHGAAVAWIASSEPRQVHVLPNLGQREQIAHVGAGNLADVQVAPHAGGATVAWVEKGAHDARVWVGQAGAKNKEKPRAHAIASYGDQALVALEASGDGRTALLAWEQDLDGSVAPRQIRLESFDIATDKPLGEATLAFDHTDGVPKFVGDGSGFSVLTLGALATRDNSAGIVNGLNGPIYTHVDATLRVERSHAIRIAELKDHGSGASGIPHSVQGLQCQLNLCSLLARGSDTPTVLTLATLPPKKTPWKVPLTTHQKTSGPTIVDHRTWAVTDEPISELSVATLPDGRSIAVWVTDYVGGDPSQPIPAVSKLYYQFIAANGTPGTPTLVSKRAISIGGVSVVATGLDPKTPKTPIATIAWAGPSEKSAQVFITQIGANEKKVKQKTLTRGRRKSGGAIPNEVFDVNIVNDGKGGYVVAWADTKDGNLEIYGANVRSSLQRKGRVHRITETKGASTDLALRRHGDQIWVAWTETPEKSASNNLTVASLSAADLAPVVKAHSVYSEGVTSRPMWGSSGGSTNPPTLGWLQAIADGQRVFMWSGLGQTGQFGKAPKRIAIPNTPIIEAAFRCAEKVGCRMLFFGNTSSPVTVFAAVAERSSDTSPRITKLGLLPFGNLEQVFLGAIGDSGNRYIFAQTRDGKHPHIRTLSIDGGR